MRERFKVATINHGYGKDSTALLGDLTEGLGIKKFIIYKERFKIPKSKVFAVVRIMRKAREFYGFVNIYQRIGE